MKVCGQIHAYYGIRLALLNIGQNRPPPHPAPRLRELMYLLRGSILFRGGLETK